MTWIEWYDSLAKPSWTPAPPTISLIWMTLYPVIVASFGFVFVQAFRRKLPRRVALPFAVDPLLPAPVRPEAETRPVSTASPPNVQPATLALSAGGAVTDATTPPFPSGRTTRTPIALADELGALWAAADAPRARTVSATTAAWTTRWLTIRRLSARAGA